MSATPNTTITDQAATSRPDPRDLLALTGRTVVVAGAGAGGIGEGVATVLGAAGARVVAADIDEDRLGRTADSLAAAGATCEPIIADACDPASFDRVVDLATSDADAPLGGLVHVVGGMHRHQWAPFGRFDMDEFDSIMGLNLRSTAVTLRGALGGMAAGGRPGSIVLIASISGLQGMPFAFPYSAAKAAVMNMAMTAALEYGPRGIRVNAIAPGSIQTVASPDPEDPVGRAAVPLGRRGTPWDIAHAALFLLSDLAGFVSGQTLRVDGGAYAKPAYIDDVGIPVFMHDDELRQRLLA